MKISTIIRSHTFASSLQNDILPHLRAPLGRRETIEEEIIDGSQREKRVAV